MQTTLQLKRRLDYARFVHLCVVFIIALFLFLFSTIPERRWILLTVIVISAGIEPGLIIRRAAHRLGGTIGALLIMIPLIFLMQLNYRLIPVLFITAIIAMNVTALNPSRYNISVFFMTLVVFLLLAQTTDAYSPEGPIEMVINRGSCTLIGILIVVMGDYFLFQSYRYSHRLYLFHQIMVFNFFKKGVRAINKCKKEKGNTFLFIERLRDQIISNFGPIAISSENLRLENKVNASTRQRIEVFQKTIWELRRLLFALCMSELVIKSPGATEKHLEKLHQLMKIARDNFIFLK